MPKFIYRLPDIGEGIAKAEIVAWHVKVGDRVQEDGRLADMMTDKATVEMESPVAGVVTYLAGEVGDVVAIGSTLVEIETDGECEGGTDAVETKAPAPEAPAVTIDQPLVPEIPSPSPVPDEAPMSKPEDPAPRVLASAAVRSRARELGINLADVRPADDGRIRHADLDAFLTYNLAGGYRPAGIRRDDTAIKLTGLRRRIAENMAASKQHIPHFSYVEELDVTLLEEMRGSLNEGRNDRPRLTMLPFLVTAICRLLPDYPMLNARFDDEQGVVTHHGAVHMGIATQTPVGLMVPVLRNAQDRNLWQIAAEVRRLAEAARDGTAKGEELSGSTITLTSLGPLGGVAATPVINRPEVAIIGPNRIVERPMFVDDGLGGQQIARRKLMNISISCDHRVVDGWDAASFIQALRRLVEAPALLLAP